MRQFFDKINEIFIMLSGILVMLVVCTISLEVVLRFFFNKPILYLIEFNQIFVVYITFLSAAWILKKEGHVEVDIVVEMLKPRAKAILGIITSFVGMIICFVIIVNGFQVALLHFKRSFVIAGTPIPTWIHLIIIPIGSFLMMVEFSYKIYRNYKTITDVSSNTISSNGRGV